MISCVFYAFIAFVYLCVVCVTVLLSMCVLSWDCISNELRNTSAGNSIVFCLYCVTVVFHFVRVCVISR